MPACVGNAIDILRPPPGLEDILRTPPKKDLQSSSHSNIDGHSSTGSSTDGSKRRGQRGRLACQKREFKETGNSMDIELKKLIDQIYRIPLEVLKKVKHVMQTLPPEVRSQRGVELIRFIQDLGNASQQRRPDCPTLKPPPRDGLVTPVEDLDGKVKWLVGKLHLLVRKMKEAGQDFLHINATITGLLKECETMPDIALGLYSQVDKDSDQRLKWLKQKLLSFKDGRVSESRDSAILENAAVLAKAKSRELWQRLEACTERAEFEEIIEQLRGQTVQQAGSEVLEFLLPDILKELPESCHFLSGHIEVRVREALQTGLPMEEIEDQLEAVGCACGKLDEQIKMLPNCFREAAEKGIRTDVVAKIKGCGLAELSAMILKYA